MYRWPRPVAVGPWRLLADPRGLWPRRALVGALRHLLRARRDGLPLACRLRGTDDHPWHRHAVPISEPEAEAIAARYGVDVAPGVETMAARLAALPELRPYEYSKAPTLGPLGLIAQRDAGADVTASFAADRATAAADGIAAIRAGFRLAVPVALRKGDPVPSHSHLLAVGGEAVTSGRHRWRRFRPPVGRPPRGGRDPANEAQPRRRP